MIVVTGGAGFIGSCIVASLNERGRTDIFVVDHLESGAQKCRNLAGKNYVDYFDKKEFLHLIMSDQVYEPIDAVIHMGACSSTTLSDQQYYRENNFEYSCHVARWALARKARLIYASSAATYGDGELGYSDDDDVTRRLQPLNYYGESKQQFDVWILNQGLERQCVGLKFFNVFGPNEYHKGDMRSVVAKTYQRVAREGRISLFKSYKPEYADGEQKRDFIYVKDVVDVVLFFMDHPEQNGIFNVGTGQARTWNDLAKAIFAAVGKSPVIEYVDMPGHLRPRYQYFTQAVMAKLRKAGYMKEFISLEDAVRDYVPYLAKENTL
ncbi:MAG: ADP-glyceromanno-heptose 6-epimerase [Candidatus Omnitrophota bacterium]|jgi:ADP-L-glycero-D-manno-heptose 6-epimerase